MYTAVELSKYITAKCTADNYPISNLQLQKILYYIQRDYIKRDNRAIADDFEAWRFGPVAPNSYYHFCGFGAMPILTDYNEDITIKPSDKKIIDLIIEEKRCLKPWDMIDEMQKPGGAWDKIYKNGSGDGQIIPVALIKAEQ